MKNIFFQIPSHKIAHVQRFSIYLFRLLTLTIPSALCYCRTRTKHNQLRFQLPCLFLSCCCYNFCLLYYLFHTIPSFIHSLLYRPDGNSASNVDVYKAKSDNVMKRNFMNERKWKTRVDFSV